VLLCVYVCVHVYVCVIVSSVVRRSCGGSQVSKCLEIVYVCEGVGCTDMYMRVHAH
jgi:hypothetical protein